MNETPKKEMPSQPEQQQQEEQKEQEEEKEKIEQIEQTLTTTTTTNEPETNEIEQPHNEPPTAEQLLPPLEEEPLIELPNESIQKTTKEKELSDSYFDEPEY